MSNHVQQIAKTGDLTHINGSVLRTLNVISGGKCRLSDLECVFNGINRYHFLDSLEYLAESEYIELKNGTTGSRTDLETGQFSATNAVLTGKGIRILQGFLTDECVEV